MTECLICGRECDDTSFKTNGNRICSKKCGRELFKLDLFWMNYYTDTFDFILVEKEARTVRSLLGEMRRIAAYLGK